MKVALIFTAVAAVCAALSLVLWGSDAGVGAAVAAILLVAAGRLRALLMWLRARLARPRWTDEERKVLNGEERLR